MEAREPGTVGVVAFRGTTGAALALAEGKKRPLGGDNATRDHLAAEIEQRRVAEKSYR